MRLSLKCGESTLSANISDHPSDVLWLEPQRPSSASHGRGRIRSALQSPVGGAPLGDRVSAGQQVAIVTSDVTRPCPSALLLPPVLDELNRAGIPDGDITVVFGLGTHRPHTCDERLALVGPDVNQRVRCIDSDPSDTELIGHTTRGTPIWVFSPVLQADVRVCLGVIEYHYFAGYSGGVKAIVPGVCGQETVQHNHSMMLEPGAETGNIDGNPLRADIDEAGATVGVDFILNVILDDAKRIVATAAGDPLEAHRRGCAQLDSFGRIQVPRLADLVLVSAGGHPKDINLYQAQKALDNALHLVRPGGVVILVAECSEGLGHPTFEAWMQDAEGPDAIIARIKRKFELGGHKAAALAMALKQATIYLVSKLSPGQVRSMGLHPFESLDEAIASAKAALKSDLTLAVMPQGGSVLPQVSANGAGQQVETGCEPR